MVYKFICLIITPFLFLAIILMCLPYISDNSVPFLLRKSASNSPISFTSTKLYGPYVGGESVTFEWSYKNVSNTSYATVNDYFILSCPSYSSTPIHSKRVSRHALSAGASYSCSYTYSLNTTRFHMESGLVIKVGVQYNGSYLNIIEKTIKPIVSKNINPLDYRAYPYKIKDRSFYLNETDVEESFLFDEYRDYVECDGYNRLLFSNLSFKYSYPLALTYDEANIKFIDRENIFPLIKKDGDGYTYFPINLNENYGVVFLEITSLYYDPVTLVCNDSGTGNKSKYLFVPKGKARKLKEYEFIVEAHNLGINKTSFSHAMEVSISPFFLGEDYVVIGGVRE